MWKIEERLFDIRIKKHEICFRFEFRSANSCVRVLVSCAWNRLKTIVVISSRLPFSFWRAFARPKKRPQQVPFFVSPLNNREQAFKKKRNKKPRTCRCPIRRCPIPLVRRFSRADDEWRSVPTYEISPSVWRPSYLNTRYLLEFRDWLARFVKHWLARIRSLFQQARFSTDTWRYYRPRGAQGQTSANAGRTVTVLQVCRTPRIDITLYGRHFCRKFRPGIRTLPSRPCSPDCYDPVL